MNRAGAVNKIKLARMRITEAACELNIGSETDQWCGLLNVLRPGESVLAVCKGCSYFRRYQGINHRKEHSQKRPKQPPQPSIPS
jgi:hypothetical protein